MFPLFSRRTRRVAGPTYRPALETLELRDLPSVAVPVNLTNAVQPAAARPAATANANPNVVNALNQNPAAANAAQGNAAAPAAAAAAAPAAASPGQAPAGGDAPNAGRPGSAAPEPATNGQQNAPNFAPALQGVPQPGQSGNSQQGALDPAAAAVGRAFSLSDDADDRLFKMDLEGTPVVPLLDEPGRALFDFPAPEPTAPAAELVPVSGASFDSISVLVTRPAPTEARPADMRPGPPARLLQESLPFAAEADVPPVIVQAPSTAPVAAEAADDGDDSPDGEE